MSYDRVVEGKNAPRKLQLSLYDRKNFRVWPRAHLKALGLGRAERTAEEAELRTETSGAAWTREQLESYSQQPGAWVEEGIHLSWGKKVGTERSSRTWGSKGSLTSPWKLFNLLFSSMIIQKNKYRHLPDHKNNYLIANCWFIARTCVCTVIVSAAISPCNNWYGPVRKEQRGNYSINGAFLPSANQMTSCTLVYWVAELNHHVAHGSRSWPNSEDLLDTLTSWGHDSILASNIDCNVKLILWIWIVRIL